MHRLTDEQRLLVDSTRRFLAENGRTVDDGDHWRRGAELGWTALLADGTGRDRLPAWRCSLASSAGAMHPVRSAR